MKTPTLTPITVGTRTAVLHTPPNPGAWLLVCLHPSGSNGRAFANVTQFAKLADSAGFFSVFPDAIGGVWDTSSRTDLDFLDALVAQLKTNNSSIQHVGAVGYSNGAEMAATWTIASQTPEALACCSGGLSNDVLKQYGLPPRAVTFISFWGKADPVWKYDGWAGAKFGQQLLGAQDNLAIWSQINGCTENSSVQPVENSTTVTVQTATDGTDSTSATLYTSSIGGHTWPGSNQTALVGVLGPTDMSISATQLVWDAFSASVLA